MADLDLQDELRRLHDEIRSLNGQIEGMQRTIAALKSRLDRVTQERDRLREQLRGQPPAWGDRSDDPELSVPASPPSGRWRRLLRTLTGDRP